MRINFKLGKLLLHYSGTFKVYTMIPDLLGMQSVCDNKRHVLFLDFDKQTVRNLKKKIRHIQNNYGLGNVYVFRSSEGNFHALCFDKLTFGMCADIDLELGMDKYLKHSVLRGFWVLRVSPKEESIKYLFCIEGHSLFEGSRCHYEFLSAMYPDMKAPDNLDNSNNVKFDIYTSVVK